MSDQYNLKDFVVWLDANMDQTKDCIDTKVYLHEGINYLRTFNNPDNCIDYITSIQNEKVFFIVSGSMGEIVAPLIDDIQQIHSVYVFCCNKAKQEWTKQCPKISGIFVDKQPLLAKIKEDIESCSKELLPMSIFSPKANGEHSLRDLSKENATFMWYHFLIRILLLMPATRTDLAKNEMLEECRLYYKDNQTVQNNINKFEKDYKSEKAVWWYTCDGFIYRLLNKALRTQNIEAIFKFRFFIADLQRQLCQLHHQYRQSLGSDISPFLTVFRGQVMTSVEVENLKRSIGGLISMNTFLSTTRKRDVAVAYAGSGELCNSTLESVLFEIQVDMKIETKPFCYINQLSMFYDEEEVLFSIGTVFQVETIELMKNKIWNVKMILSGEHDKRSEALTTYFKKEIGKSPSVLTLGWFLNRLGDFDMSERFYRTLLKQLPSNHGDVGTIYNNLGLLYKDKGSCLEAVKYYELALKAYSTTRSENHPQIGATYSNMSAAYLSLSEYNMAEKTLKKAHCIFSHSLNPDHPSLASIYNHFGEICLGALYKEKDDTRTSLDCYKKALAVYTKSLPEKHLDFAEHHNDIGLVYMKNGNILTALTSFETARKIGLDNLRPNHPKIIEYQRNIETAKQNLESHSHF
ncbi:unnamed protein product [Didymodactylos carnosus]|uniref:NAD(P)(+)--arginine ADP-ribosyltransferase n=1 Tax=Didymodactylos carnosus TaxID=1234261 RepID=A0A8S2NBN9_9BILA|nr:unnamed protein product [Didymodactylos carnosus]